jgi:GNAT superfamily N-acetyltransferase
MIRTCLYSEIAAFKYRADRGVASIDDGRKMTWIGAFDKEFPVGCVALRDIGKNRARLNSIFVCSEHRGKKIGTKLVQALVQTAIINGFVEIETRTPKGELMMQFGFKPTGRDFAFGGSEYILRLK